MENNKPRLSLDEQIQHLKDKGILFNIMDEDSANSISNTTIIIIS